MGVDHSGCGCLACVGLVGVPGVWVWVSAASLGPARNPGLWDYWGVGSSHVSGVRAGVCVMRVSLCASGVSVLMHVPAPMVSVERLVLDANPALAPPSCGRPQLPVSAASERAKQIHFAVPPPPYYHTVKLPLQNCAKAHRAIAPSAYCESATRRKFQRTRPARLIPLPCLVLPHSCAARSFRTPRGSTQATQTVSSPPPSPFHPPPHTTTTTTTSH
jgi:hypothetical protein